MDSYWCIVGFLNSTLRLKGVDSSITLDAAKWNCDGAEPQPTRFTRPVSRKRDVTEPGRQGIKIQRCYVCLIHL